jgi:hypothetical protein
VWEHLKKPGSFRSWVAFAGGAAFTVAGYALSQWMQPARSVLDRGQPPSHAVPLPWTLRFYTVLKFVAVDFCGVSGVRGAEFSEAK